MLIHFNYNHFLCNNLFNITFTLYITLKLRLCLMGNLCGSIDLKTKNPFFIPLDTWIMIDRIVDNSRICFITCFTQNTLFSFDLFQISFDYTSSNLSIKLVWNYKSSKPNLKPITNYTQSNVPTVCVDDCSKVKVHELVRSPLPKHLTFK